MDPCFGKSLSRPDCLSMCATQSEACNPVYRVGILSMRPGKRYIKDAQVCVSGSTSADCRRLSGATPYRFANFISPSSD